MAPEMAEYDQNFELRIKTKMIFLFTDISVFRVDLFTICEAFSLLLFKRIVLWRKVVQHFWQAKKHKRSQFSPIFLASSWQTEKRFCRCFLSFFKQNGIWRPQKWEWNILLEWIFGWQKLCGRVWTSVVPFSRYRTWNVSNFYCNPHVCKVLWQN